jgi:acetyl-CoA synthetase
VRWGNEFPQKHDMSSLRLLGSVGEPINPEAWMWYHEIIGGGRCPIVDTWWQTETGAIMMTPGPGHHAREAGELRAAVLRRRAAGGEARRHAVRAERGRLPDHQEAVAVDAARDPRRSRALREAVLVEIKGVYFTGDGSRQDQDGYFWVMGRVDDVLNVAGHRLGTAEIESALVSHPGVAEAAVVGPPHELKGRRSSRS